MTQPVFVENRNGTDSQRESVPSLIYYISELLLLHSRIALAAINGSIVLRLEGYAGFLSAVCANSGKELSLRLSCVLSCVAASLASLGLVLEASLCIELLLACCEGELLSAVLTLQNLVFVHFATSL